MIFDIRVGRECPFEATRRLTKVLPKTKVVFYTGYLSEYSVDRAFDSGAVGTVSKKADAVELIECISKVSDGERFACSVTKSIANNSCYLNKGYDDNWGLSSNWLSERELEVLKGVAEGFSSREIAQNLNISYNTCRRHQQNLMSKLRLHSKVHLTNFAHQQGILNINESFGASYEQ